MNSKNTVPTASTAVDPLCCGDAAVATAMVSKLGRVRGTMKKEDYCHILDEILKDSAKCLIGKRKFHFQHDNGPDTLIFIKKLDKRQ